MVKNKTMEYCKTKSKLLKNREKEISTEIKALDSSFINNPNNVDIYNQLQNKKKELEIIQVHKTKGAIIRSRE